MDALDLLRLGNYIKMFVIRIFRLSSDVTDILEMVYHPLLQKSYIICSQMVKF